MDSQALHHIRLMRNQADLPKQVGGRLRACLLGDTRIVVGTTAPRSSSFLQP